MADNPTVIGKAPVIRHSDGTIEVAKPVTKQDVAFEALYRGTKWGLVSGAYMGLLDAHSQSIPKPGKLLEALRFPFMRTGKTFEFNPKSFNTALGVGLGLGFAAGAISATIGAIHQNPELARAISTPVQGERVAP